MSVFVYASGALIRYKSSNQTDARELLVKMELPFEIKSTSIYIAILVTQFIHQMSTASTEGVLNSLLISLVSSFYNSMFLQTKIDMTLIKKISRIEIK